MSLLLRLLTARVSSAFRAPAVQSVTAEANTPMSVRLPPEVKAELQRLADAMDLSLHQTVVTTLKALTEADPLAVQVGLMRERLRYLARAYRLDVTAIQVIEPALTPDTLVNDDLLARALTPDLIARVSERLMLNPGWLEGQPTGAGYGNWYSNPGDPVRFVQQHGADNVTVYWTAAALAPWLNAPADDDESSPAMTPEEREQGEYEGDLGLFIAVRGMGAPHTLYRAWTPERMTYARARIVARIIATRLHELGAQQVGLGIGLSDYQALGDGRLLPGELLRAGLLAKWAVADVLLLGQGLYQHEDTYVDDDYAWAGALDLTSITVKRSRR